MKLPCGRCIGCRIIRAREWTVRCVHEASMTQPWQAPSALPENAFITLTYNDEHLPADYSVGVHDWQIFAKKLRRSLGKFRYFMCAEYGEETLRPHYHALIFGQSFRADRVLKKSKPHKLWNSETLDQAWTDHDGESIGHSMIGNLTPETAAYCSRYCMKKLTGEKADAYYSRTHPLTGEVHQVKPEFVTMSRRPGVGSTWISTYKEDALKDGLTINGKPYPTPNFYLTKMSPDQVSTIKAKRLAFALAHAHEEERLHVREDVQLLKNPIRSF